MTDRIGHLRPGTWKTLGVLLLITASLWACQDGNPCLMGGSNNATAYLNDQKVEMQGRAHRVLGAGMEYFQPIWTVDVSIHLDIERDGCDHKISFITHNTWVGVHLPGNMSKDGSHVYSGVYHGELGAASMTSDSYLEITALTETGVSGVFTAILTDGTTFTSGEFTDVPIVELTVDAASN